MSLLWIIPAVWLLVAVAVVLLCRGARSGDQALDEAIEPARRKATLSGVVILKETSSPLSVPGSREGADPAAAPEPAQADHRTPAPVGG